MMKPLFRFTLGPCLPQGMDILAESLSRTTRALGKDRFDWLICYNGLNGEEVEKLNGIAKTADIPIYSQQWQNCPVPDECGSPRRNDGTFEGHGSRCGGTLWKVCPPRMRLESHEFVMDNDIVLLKLLPQIDAFLQQTEQVLILEEPVRFYGRYDHLFPGNDPFLNSGFYGLPPGYDFGREIRLAWERNGKLTKISQADEQGLLMHVLSSSPNLRIRSHEIVEVLAKDYRVNITGFESGIHFTQANRIPNHRSWINYQRVISSLIAL